MPEATVDEYGDTGAAKDKIGAAGEGRLGPGIHSVPKTAAMDFAPKKKLGGCADSSDADHAA